jgi:T1SS-143 domain-containing protein
VATEIGMIKTLIGTAVATASDGSQRTLQAGDRVFQDEVITTGAAGAVEIEFSDGSVMTLGRSSQAVLDLDTFNPQAVAEAPADVEGEVDALQQALLEGADPSQIGEATAAGAGAGPGGNEGTDVVQVIYEAPEVTPESGFETTGITLEFDEEREEIPFDDTPTAGITTVLLDEDDLYNFAGGKGEEGHAELRAAFDAIKSDFETAEELSAHPHKANGPGLNDEQEGDDLPPDAKVFVSSLLNVDFGADGPGDIVFNAEGTQPAGLTSGGEDIQYWVSADGHSLVAYIDFEHGRGRGPQGEDSGEDGGQESHAHIIFTAEITDVTTGEFQVMLLGPVDHPDGTTEDNLFVNLGFTISDLDGDTAAGVLRLDIDDDSPVIVEDHYKGGEGNDRGEDSPPPPGEGEDLTVDEDDIDGRGNQDNAPGDDYSNTYQDLSFNFGADGPAADDPVALSPEGIVDQNGDALTSNGVELQYTWDGDSDTLIGYTDDVNSPVLTISVDYVEQTGAGISVNLLDNIDHPQNSYEDNLEFNVTYTVTDFDGDSVSSTFGVDIDDDMPAIVPQRGSVDEEGLPTGNAGDSYNTETVTGGVLLIPELEEGNLSSALSGEAKDTIRTFVENGGNLVINAASGSNDESLINSIFGFSITSGGGGSPYAQTGDAAGTVFASGPASLSYENGTYQWSASSLPAEAIVMYGSGDGAAVVVIPVGSGQITFLAYDWFDAAPVGSQDGGWLEILDIVVSQSGSPADVSIFDNGSFVDTSGGYDAESDNIQATLNGQGHNVTTFTGLSAADFADALQVTIGDLPGEDLTAQGNLGISWGADDRDVDGTDAANPEYDRSVSFDEQSAPEGLTSNGVAIVYSVSEDGLTLTATAGEIVVFTVVITDEGTGTYDFTLLDNLDHPEVDTEDDINLSFDFTATDSDGDAVGSHFTITVDDDAPVIGEALSEDDGNSILLGARDGSADLDDWGVAPEALTGTVTMNGVTANISFQDNDSNPSSMLRIYNNNADHIGGGSLADNDNEGINAGETLTISFDKLMQQAEIGVDGLGNHFLPGSSEQAHATWVAYKNGVEVGSGEIDNPEGQNEGPAGLLEVFTVSIPGGFDSIVLGNNSNNDGSNYEVRYLQAQTLNIVDEEGLQPEGNLGDSYSDNGDVAGAALTASADLNILWGSDDNNSGTANRSVTFDDVQSGLAGLTSNDVPVTFVLSEGDTVLTAKAGEATVFTVNLSDLESGSFDFSLLDNLDHPTANTEDDINLTFAFTATDSDGDTVNGSFSVTVDDDAPVATDATVSATVDEDDINTKQSQGNHPNDGDSDGSTTNGPLEHGPALVSGSVASLASFGADEDGSFTLSTDFTAIEAQGLTSDGDALSYAVSGDTLTATAGGRTVFTLQVESDGDYEFRLFDQLDHADGEGQNNLALNLSSLIVATDSDGDAITLDSGFTINVTDDVPEVTGSDTVRFDEDDLLASRGAGESDGNDNSDPDGLSVSSDIRGDVNWGADGFGRVVSVSVLGDGEPAFVMPETSGDDTVTVYFDENGAVTSVEADAAVTLLVEEDGDYTVTLNDNLLVEGANENLVRLFDGGIRINAADADGDVAQGGVFLNIDITDDVPVLTGSGSDTIRIDEDDLVGGNDNSNPDRLSVTDSILGDASWGADGFGRVNSISIDGDGRGPYQLPETGGADSLTIYFGQDGEVQTGASGAAVSLLVNEDGSYTVTLHDNLLVGGAGENLVRILDGGIRINAEDADGDQLASGVTLNIDIIDDVPVATGTTVSATIDEDDINTVHSQGTSQNDGTHDGSTTNGPIDSGPALVSGSVASLVSLGADGGAFSLATDFSGLLAQGLESKGDALSYSVVGDLLLAKAEGGRTVFTLELEANGDYEFRLYDQLDHADGNGQNNLPINLSSAVVATDNDNDSITLNSGFTINVTDDVPEIDVTSTGADMPTLTTQDADTIDAVIIDGIDPIELVDDSSSSDTYDLGIENADKPVSIQFNATTVGGWDESGGSQDYFIVNVNGVQQVITSVDGSTDYTLNAVADVNGQVTVEFITDVTWQTEGVTVTGLTIRTGDVDSGSFAGLFTLTSDMGADDDGSVSDLSYALSVTNAASGLSSDGEAITLAMNNGVIEGSTLAGVIFAISVDAATGEVSLTQYAEIDHVGEGDDSNAFNNSVNNLGLASGTIALTASATITDNDDDTASDSEAIDISAAISFDDDLPTVERTTAQVDEDDIDVERLLETSQSVEYPPGFGPESFDAEAIEAAIGYFSIPSAIGNNDEAVGDDLPPLPNSSMITTGTLNVSFGADGAGDITFNAAGTQPTGLTSGGVEIQYLVSEDGHSLVGYTAVEHEIIFTAQVDGSNGNYAVTLFGPLDHPDTTTEDNILFDLGYTATDSDGDSVQGTLTVDVDDDTPTIDVDVTAADMPTLTTQDADTIDTASDTDSGSFAGLFTLTQDMGADEGGTAGSLSYALSVTNAVSGLSSDGEAITLAMNNGVIEGSTSAGVVFEISVDASGDVTLTQHEVIDHVGEGDDNNAFNNSVNNLGLASGTIALTASATITDGDGDSVSDSQAIDISGAISFDDDIPGQPADINKTVQETGGSNDTNLMIILDVSGSMDTSPGIPGFATRLAVAKDAIDQLISSYDAAGDVMVRIVRFHGDAHEEGGVWMTATQASTYITSLSDTYGDGSTNFDAALAAAQSAFGDSGKIAGGQNVSYFLSDGQPTSGSGESGPGSSGGDGIGATEQSNWETFLNNNNITSHALGLGTGVSATALEPIAYDGDAVIVDDLADLAAILAATVASPELEGNLVTEGLLSGDFGADGPAALQIVAFTHDGTTYTTASTEYDSGTKSLTIETAADGAITVNFETGAYSYESPGNVDVDTPEVFVYTIEDGDGDQQNGNLTIVVEDSVPVAYDNANQAMVWNETVPGEDIVNTITLADFSNTRNSATSGSGYNPWTFDSYDSSNVSGDERSVQFDSSPTNAPDNKWGIEDSYWNGYVTGGKLRIDDQSDDFAAFATPAFTIATGDTAKLSFEISNEDINGDDEGQWQLLEKVGGTWTTVADSGEVRVNGTYTTDTMDAGTYRLYLRVEDDESGPARLDVDNIILTTTTPGADTTRVTYAIAAGNVLTDANTLIPSSDAWGAVDSEGVDGAALMVWDGGAFIDPTVSGTTIVGSYGSLTIESDGSYSYTPNADISNLGEQDVFTYQLVDADGDTDDAQLVITIGGTPYVEPVPLEGAAVTGTAEDDVILGTDGNDVINGGLGNDHIEGGAGNDNIFGSDGDDVIFGGAGNDMLTGGNDADTFVWNKADVGVDTPAHDTVVDFDATEGDVLNLADLLGDSSHTIEGIEVGAPGSEHLQLNIKDGANNIVQEIELQGVTTGGNATNALDALLISGAIDDGI